MRGQKALGADRRGGRRDSGALAGLSEDLDPAGIDVAQIEQALDAGGLAGAVGPDRARRSPRREPRATDRPAPDDGRTACILRRTRSRSRAVPGGPVHASGVSSFVAVPCPPMKRTRVRVRWSAPRHTRQRFGTHAIDSVCREFLRKTTANPGWNHGSWHPRYPAPASSGGGRGLNRCRRGCNSARRRRCRTRSWSRWSCTGVVASLTPRCENRGRPGETQCPGQGALIIDLEVELAGNVDWNVVAEDQAEPDGLCRVGGAGWSSSSHGSGRAACSR